MEPGAAAPLGLSPTHRPSCHATNPERTRAVRHRPARSPSSRASRALLLCGLVPLLPVKQTTATIAWPQAPGPDGLVTDITAPLVSGAPQALDVSIPCRAIATLPAGGGLVLSTIPPAGHRRHPNGLFVTRHRRRRRSSRSATRWPRWRPRARGGVRRLQHAARLGQRRAASAPTSSAYPAPPARCAAEKKPQVAGVFTDLKVAAQPGLSARIDVDTRFITSPTALKLGRDGARRRLCAGVDRGAGGAGPPEPLGGDISRSSVTCSTRLATILARRACRPGSPTSASSAPCCCGIVIGAISSDDGYNLTIARVSGDAGYTANYYRFFGATEAPFDWYQSRARPHGGDQHGRRVDAAARHRGGHRDLADHQPLRAAAARQAAGEQPGRRRGRRARCSWPRGCRSTTACGRSRSSRSAPSPRGCWSRTRSAPAGCGPPRSRSSSRSSA